MYFSIKPFAQGAFGLVDTKPPTTMVAQPPATPAWHGRSIATHKLRLLEHSAFVDQQRDQDSYHKHLFVHIGGAASYSDPLLEVGTIIKSLVRFSIIPIYCNDEFYNL